MRTYIRRGLLSAMLLAAMPWQALAAGALAVDDFEGSAEGAFPSGWSSEKRFWQRGCGGRGVSVKSENGNKYLAVDSAGDSCTIGREFRYTLSDHRSLSWRWRVRVLPKGGDESDRRRNDSAAGLYVCFGRSMLPYCIKYVWSASLKAGTVLPSPHRKATKIMVLRSGTAGLGTWQQEKRDVYADYLRVFGAAKAADPAGFALLTDSDDTGSAAAADYDDIKVSGD